LGRSGALLREVVISVLVLGGLEKAGLFKRVETGPELGLIVFLDEESGEMADDSGLTSIKIVAVGDGAVGKTSLLISYSLGRFPTEYVPTVFDNFEKVEEFEGEKYVLGLWDTAGQEEYDHLRPISYPETDIFLVCFSMDDGTRSLDSIWSKWKPELDRYAPDTPFILVGTKFDLYDEEVMGYSEADLEALAKEKGAIAYISTSSKDMHNVDKLFDIAAHTVLKDPAARKKLVKKPSISKLSKKSSKSTLDNSMLNEKKSCCSIM